MSGCGPLPESWPDVGAAGCGELGHDCGEADDGGHAVGKSDLPKKPAATLGQSQRHPVDVAADVVAHQCHQEESGENRELVEER